MSTTKTTGWKRAALALVALAALLALRLAWSARGARAAAGADAEKGAAAPEAFRWPMPDAGLWKVFRSGEPAAAPATAGALSTRYRLAGVFLVLSETGRSGAEHRCAILDDLQTKQQHLASEEEWIAERAAIMEFDGGLPAEMALRRATELWLEAQLPRQISLDRE